MPAPAQRAGATRSIRVCSTRGAGWCARFAVRCALPEPGGQAYREQEGKGAQCLAARAQGSAPMPVGRGGSVSDVWLPVEIEVAADGVQAIHRRVCKHAALRSLCGWHVAVDRADRRRAGGREKSSEGVRPLSLIERVGRPPVR